MNKLRLINPLPSLTNPPKADFIIMYTFTAYLANSAVTKIMKGDIGDLYL